METYINRDPDLTRGYNLLVNFKFSKAIKPLNKVAHNKDLDPRIRSEAYTFLGYAYMNMRDTVRCLEALKKATDFNPKNPLAYYFLAHENFLSGDFGETKRNLEKAVKIHPKFVSALRMLAELYKDEGELKKSAELYKKIINIFPNSGYFRYQYYKICNKLRDYDEVEKTLNVMIKLQPKYRPNYINLGENYIKQGKYDKAMNEFNRIVEKTPSTSRGYEGRAKVYYHRGEWKKAIKEANKALSLSPGNIYVKSLVSDLEKAREKENKKKAIERKRTTLWIILVFLLLGVCGALIYFIILHRRKKYVIGVIQNFNKSIDEIYDLDSLAHYLLNFFMVLGRSPRSIFLLFNRQNNELSIKDYNGFDREAMESFNLFAGEDVTNWMSGVKRYILKVDDLKNNSLFKTAFPSLIDHMMGFGITYLIPLREKNTLVGFVALDEIRVPGRILPYESDLLMSLSTTSAQALTSLMLYEISVSDETTGLFNKRYFMQTLNTEMKRSERYKQSLSLITFDIDDFKSLNDNYGHSQGDLILKEFGAVIRKSIREGIDLGARVGGEEFSVILPATDSEKAYIAAERLRRAVQLHWFPGFPEESDESITISLGVATFPGHAGDEKTLIEKANEVMCLAKRTGKNKVCMVDHLEESDLHLPEAGSGPLKRQKPVGSSLLSDTGFFSRAYFEERFTGELRRSERNSRTCSILLITPDIELSESERIGIFREMSKILRTNLRRGIDVPAHIEKDTLAVLIPETDQHKASQVARRLKLLIDRSALLSGERRVTFSFGISNYPNLGRTEESFLEAARQALRMCRKLGGDSVMIGTPL